MNTGASHILIPAPLKVVRQILLEPTSLAEWNPAFVSVTGRSLAVVGERYPLVARGGLRGHWEYRAIGESVIDAYWQVPGLAETSTWQLLPHHRGTHVRHSFSNHGAVATMLRGAFGNVADLRLGRLAERAEGRVPLRAA